MHQVKVCIVLVFLLNALTQSNSLQEPCYCYMLGTIEDSQGRSACDANSFCECLPNVVGKDCDKCAPGHFDILTAKGCQPCNCDQEGAETVDCHQTTGQCMCKTGYTGVQCNMCDLNVIGQMCAKCEADFYFDRENRTCVECPGCYHLIGQKLNVSRVELGKVAKIVDKLLDFQKSNKEQPFYDFLIQLKTVENNICGLLNKLNQKPKIIQVVKLKHLSTILDQLNSAINDILTYLNGHINFHHLEKKLHLLNELVTSLEQTLKDQVGQNTQQTSANKLSELATDLVTEANAFDNDANAFKNSSTELEKEAIQYNVRSNLMLNEFRLKQIEFLKLLNEQRGKLIDVKKWLAKTKKVWDDAKDVKDEAQIIKEDSEKLKLPELSPLFEDSFENIFKDLSERILKGNKKFDLVNDINKILVDSKDIFDKVNELQDQKDKLNQDVDDTNKHLQNEFEELNNYFKKLEADMDTLDENIKKLNESIDEKQQKINEVLANNEKQKELFEKHMAVMKNLEEKEKALREKLEKYKKFKEELQELKQALEDLKELLNKRNELLMLMQEAKETIKQFQLYVNDYNDIIEALKELIAFVKLIPVDEFDKIEELYNEYDTFFNHYKRLFREKQELEEEVQKYQKLDEDLNALNFTCKPSWQVET